MLLSISGLNKTFNTAGKRQGQQVVALRDINLELSRGQAIGLVGPSGCGKTTLANIILGFLKADSGKVLFDGVDLSMLTAKQMRATRKNIQMVFQNAGEILDPLMTVGELIGEALLIHNITDRAGVSTFVADLLHQVGLAPELENRFPSSLSGGQIQRVLIARAIATKPRLLIFDEPVSALDVSVQGQILNLIQSLREELNPAILFISHDMTVVRHVSDKILHMDRGRIIRSG